MNAPGLSLATRTGLRGVSIVDTPDALAAIHRPDCAAAIWRRQPVAGFSDWINGLEPEQLPRARMILRPEGVRAALWQLCESAGTPDCDFRHMLVEDAAALAAIFSGLMDATYLRVRLDVVTTNACRRFHVDAITARLVCTYRGSGTQYGRGGQGRDPERIFAVPACTPILLRGTHWPEFPRAGLLHRSPPIEGSGETRLLLVLDPVDDPEDKV